MAKSSVLLAWLLVAQVVFLSGTLADEDDLNGLIDDYEDDNDFFGDCVDNPDFPCYAAPCNPVDKEAQEEMLKNCPRKCNVCPGYQCKDDLEPRSVTFCSTFKRACDPKSTDSPIIRYFGNKPLYRERLWNNCRKTCNYHCAPKMAAEPKCPEGKKCCWNGEIIDDKEDCDECLDKNARICSLFRRQCKCKHGVKCQNSGPGSFVYENCPETCGRCKKGADKDVLSAFRSIQK